MIATRGCSELLQQPCNYQWRHAWFRVTCCRGFPLQFRFSPKSSRFPMDSEGRSVACALAPLTPQKVACKRQTAHKSLGGKLVKERLERSSCAGLRKACAAQSRAGVVTGTDEARGSFYKSNEELSRYGVDESDYDFAKLQAPSSPRRTTQNSVELKTSTSGAAKSSSSGYKRKAVPPPAVVNDAEDDAEADGKDWCAYLLVSGDMRKTYVGVTSNVIRRLRQHNGELAGGAKAARAGRPWSLVCTVWGFGTRSEACQFEWRWKSFSKAAIGKEKAVAGDALPTSTNVAESQVILRRWAALKEAQKAGDEWKDLRVEWHSQN